MTSFSRTQLPRRSVAKHASQSWLTCAPESARPRSTVSFGSSSAIASGSLFASTLQKRVSRFSASERSSMTSSGVRVLFVPRGRRPCARRARGARRSRRPRAESKLIGRPPPPCNSAFGTRPPRGIAVRGHAFGVGPVHQLPERIPHVERERLAQVHLEHERPARDLRPHLDAVGARRGVRPR